MCGPVRSDMPNATDGAAAYEIHKNDSVRIIGRLDGYNVKILQQKGFVLTYTNLSKGELYVWDVGYFRLYNDCAVGWMIQASSPGRDNIFFLFSETPALALRLTEPPLWWILGITSVGLEWLEVGS